MNPISSNRSKNQKLGIAHSIKNLSENALFGYIPPTTVSTFDPSVISKSHPYKPSNLRHHPLENPAIQRYDATDPLNILEASKSFALSERIYSLNKNRRSENKKPLTLDDFVSIAIDCYGEQTFKNVLMMRYPDEFSNRMIEAPPKTEAIPLTITLSQQRSELDNKLLTVIDSLLLSNSEYNQNLKSISNGISFTEDGRAIVGGSVTMARVLKDTMETNKKLKERIAFLENTIDIYQKSKALNPNEKSVSQTDAGVSSGEDWGVLSLVLPEVLRP